MAPKTAGKRSATRPAWIRLKAEGVERSRRQQESHLPVVEDRGLRGIVTIGNMMTHDVGEHQDTVEYLSSYFGTTVWLIRTEVRTRAESRTPRLGRARAPCSW